MLIIKITYPYQQLRKKKSALIHEICKQNIELYFEHMDPIHIIFPYCWKL